MSTTMVVVLLVTITAVLLVAAYMWNRKKSPRTTSPVIGSPKSGKATAMKTWLSKTGGSIWKSKPVKFILGGAVVALVLFFVGRALIRALDGPKPETANSSTAKQVDRTNMIQDTTIYFVAHPGKFGDSWTIPRELRGGYSFEINAKNLSVPYIIATQGTVDTITPMKPEIHLGNNVRSFAFQTLSDSTLEIEVRFFKK